MSESSFTTSGRKVEEGGGRGVGDGDSFLPLLLIWNWSLLLLLLLCAELSCSSSTKHAHAYCGIHRVFYQLDFAHTGTLGDLKINPNGVC